MRDDLRNMGASLIAAGLVWYVKGPNAGLIVAGLGIGIVLFLHFFGKKKEPQSAMPSHTQENKQEFNPRIDFSPRISVGNNSAASPAPAPIPKPKPQSKQLDLLSCEPTMIAYEYYWVEVSSTDIEPQQWKPNAFVARFRLKSARVGEQPLFAHEATAHLIYRNDKGQSQVVDYGTWLNMYEHKASFRGNSHALILSSNTTAEGESKDRQTYIFNNPHSFNIFDNPYSLRGSTILPPEHKLLLPDCTQVEVEVRTFDATLFTGTFDRVEDEWKPRSSKQD